MLLLAWWTIRRQWAADMREKDPEFFNRLIGQQNPEYLWIGCSDSRVPVSTAAASAAMARWEQCMGHQHRNSRMQQHNPFCQSQLLTLWAYAGQPVALPCNTG